MFKNLIKTALRNFSKLKGYNLLNIFGLGIGIAAATLIFLWVEDEVTWNHYFPNRDNIYIVKNNQTYDGVTFTFDASPGPLAASIKNELPGIEYSARSTFGSKVLFSNAEKRTYETGYYVDPAFFQIFKLKIISGNISGAFNSPESVVISKKLSEKFFGNENAVGKTIRIDNKQDFVVKAVFHNLPANVSLRSAWNNSSNIDWFAPFSLYLKDNTWLEGWGSNGILTFVALHPIADAEKINQSLHDYISSKDSSAKFSKPFIFPMNNWRLYNKFFNGKQAGGRIEYVRLFTIIAWIVLIIACINFMNLATARSQKRAKEVGIRKVAGADRRSLIIRFIRESVFASFVAAVFSLGLIWLVLPFFNKLVEKQLSISLFQPWHILYFFAIILICGLLAGSYPAFYLSRFNPIKVLKGMKIMSGGATLNIRKGLVIVQFSLSVIFIICTMLIYRQINHVQAREVGFAKDQLVYFQLQGDMKKNFFNIKNDLIASGLVKNATLSKNTVLQMGSNTGNFSWEGKDPEKQVLITVERVSPEYISTTGLSLTKGRDFQPNISADSNNVIINETLVKILGKEDVLGMQLRQDSSSYNIIGVVKNHLYNNMYSSPAPMILFSDTSDNNFLTMQVKSTANMQHTLSTVTGIMNKANPGYPVEPRFVDEDFERSFKSELLVGRLSAIFAILAILISCFGLFGLAAYSAEQRSKEIGIRKVLGASVQNLAILLSKDFLQLVILSCLLAFPIAWWYIYHWLENFEYRTNIGVLAFVLPSIGALLIALITVTFQAIRAATANPVKNLRTE